MLKCGLILSLVIVALFTPEASVAGSRDLYISGSSVADLDAETQAPSIDVVMDANCDNNDATTADLEPFDDTFITISVFNGSNRNVTFSRFWYQLRTGSGRFRSKKLALIRSGVAKAGESVELIGIFAHAKSGSKYLLRSNVPLADSAGVRNVTIFLSGADSAGNKVLLQGSTVVSFGDYNRCE